jgi:hypothetical protein
MRNADVVIGGRYLAKVSGTVQTVKIMAVHSLGGWLAQNESSGRSIRIKSARRLRGVAP